MILFPKLDFGRQDELVLGEKNILRQMEYVALVEKWRRDQELSSKSSWGALAIICLKKSTKPASCYLVCKKSLNFFSLPLSSAGYVQCKVFAKDLLFTDVQDDSRQNIILWIIHKMKSFLKEGTMIDGCGGVWSSWFCVLVSLMSPLPLPLPYCS